MTFSQFSSKLLLALLLYPNFSAHSVEHKLRGLIEVSYTLTDGIESYLDGNYGKFRFNDGEQFSLSQGTIIYQLDWEDKLSIHLTANAYIDGVKDNINFSESYLRYKTLPSKNGYRLEMRGGLMYPKVSMTNTLIGWTSPYTLSYSMINSWLAEELRHQGLDLTITRLGQFHNSEHDFEFSVTGFQGNDPAGSVLAWHGWTLTSRQTLRQESPALPNSHIGFVPDSSDVFLELDDRIGYQASTQWTWKNHGKLLFGYYDNQADPKVVENTQWAWRTRFFHLGVKWQLTPGVELICQYLDGDTLMQSSSGTMNLVDNKYDSGFLIISKKVSHHQFTARIETFSVSDRDTFTFDDNNEEGNAVTVNYRYRLNKQLFFQAEYNRVDSKRPSRVIKGQPQDLIERQMQFSARYFF